MHKAGFVNIIGKPNVGKSTLMNSLIGQPLSVISYKAQTTRHRILGIYNDPQHQIVFSDTPGVLDPAYKMQESMMDFVQSALIDADIFLIVVNHNDGFEKETAVLEKIQSQSKKIILALNKSDELEELSILENLKLWQERLPKCTPIPISALKRRNLEKLIDILKKAIPEHPPYYDKEALTDRDERFFVAEIIREKILKHYDKEVPYSCEVQIESFKDKKDLSDISATIYVSRESQKPILIGKKGAAIKELGIKARKSIEYFLQRKVYLELHVKVKTDWRNDDGQLKKFGY